MISRRESVRFNLRRIFFFSLSSPRNNNSNDDVYKRLLLCLYFQSSFERKLIVLMRETSSFQEVCYAWSLLNRILLRANRFLFICTEGHKKLVLVLDG